MLVVYILGFTTQNNYIDTCPNLIAGHQSVDRVSVCTGAVKRKRGTFPGEEATQIVRNQTDGASPFHDKIEALPITTNFASRNNFVT
jgi:hypothetical protein